MTVRENLDEKCAGKCADFRCESSQCTWNWSNSHTTRSKINLTVKSCLIYKFQQSSILTFGLQFSTQSRKYFSSLNICFSRHFCTITRLIISEFCENVSVDEKRYANCRASMNFLLISPWNINFCKKLYYATERFNENKKKSHTQIFPSLLLGFS